MKNLNTFIRCVVLFSCMVLVTPFSKAYCSTSLSSANYAVSSDTTKSGKKVFKASDYGHNVLDMLQQGRYRHGDAVPYSNKGLLSHLYVGTSFGIDQLAARYDYQYNPAFMWGLTIGKELNKTNALSLSFLYGKSESEVTYSYFYRYAIQLNHYFNFSRYYLGYNPKRLFEISSMLGAGYQMGEYYGQKESAPYLSLGVKGDVRLGNNVKLAIEPYVNVGSEGYNGAEKGHWYSKYNISYGARAAINYTFSNELDAEYEDYPFSRNYFFVTTGLQSLKSNIDFMQTLAPTVAFGYGHWLSPRVAMQFTAGWSAGGYKKYNTYLADGSLAYTRYTKSQYLFGRAEAVFNILSYLNDGAQLKGFALDVMGGYEFGKLWKYNTTYLDQYTDSYGGITAALRAKYYSTEGKAFYFEPRVTLATYGYEGAGYNSSIDYHRLDTRYSIALGMEYGNPEVDGDKYGKPTDDFEAKTSIFVSAGPNYVFNRETYSGGMNINGSFGFGLEYQPFKLFGVRAMFDYSSYGFNVDRSYKSVVGDVPVAGKGVWNKKFNIISGIVDAKIDLTNMFYGYNSNRKWNNAFYLGAVLSRYDKISGKQLEGPKPVSNVDFDKSRPLKNFIGGHLAFNTSYHLNDNWALFGELDMRIYGNEFMSDKTIDYNPVRTLAFRVGSSYTLDASETLLADDKDIPFAPDYFFISGGLQSLYAKMEFKNTLGPALTMGYGHWFSKYLGYQLSGGWSAGAERLLAHGRLPKTQFAFVRAEAMMNVLRALSENTGRGFSVAALAGGEFGKLWRYRSTLDDQTVAGYGGFTGALRFKYHSGEGKNLFVEPRLTYAHFDDEYLESAGYGLSRLVTRFTLSAGMEFGSPYNCGPASKIKAEDEFNPSLSVMAMAGPSYMFNRETYGKELNMDYSMALAVEYQPYKLIGFRAMLDYAKYGFTKYTNFYYKANDVNKTAKGLVDKDYTYLSGIIDVKLDMSNLLYGVDGERRWNTAIYAGPIISKCQGLSSELHSGEMKPEYENLRIYAKKPDNTTIGLHTAFNAKYSISKEWNVFGEADLRIHSNEFISESAVDYNPVRTLNFRVGVSYDIK